MDAESDLREQIDSIEKLLHEDPGNRGLAGIWNELSLHGPEKSLKSLFSSASSLSSSCKKALVCTGFVIPSVQMPETDGPPGALAICRALHFLGKQVSLITAPGNVPLLRALLECEARIYGYEIPLIEAPLISQVKDRHEWALETIAPYDHIISIEILGAASDGGYYNMRGIEASALNAPIDELFTAARKLGGHIRTISIGDGGNEIGMGNIYELVSKYVPGGAKIGSRIETDHLITAGVSNWGGYALACALYLLQKHPTLFSCKIPDTRMLPSVEVESEQLDVMLANGAVDGPTCAAERKIDSLDFDYHEKLLKRMVAMCTME